MREEIKKNIRPDGDGAHRSVIDLYEDFEQTLREAIRSGLPFHASWATKHEIANGTIDFDGHRFTLHVYVGSDEGFDLFDDAMWSICCDLKEEGVFASQTWDLIDLFGIKMSEEDLFHHWEHLINTPYPWDEDLLLSEFSASATLPVGVDLNEIIEVLASLGDEADDAAEERFERLKESIWGFLEELTNPEFCSTYIPERRRSLPLDEGRNQSRS